MSDRRCKELFVLCFMRNEIKTKLSLIYSVNFTILLSLVLQGAMVFAAESQTADSLNFNNKFKKTTSVSVDFCPKTSKFDFRNAYWLGTFSYQAYKEPKYVVPILSGLADALMANLPQWDEKEPLLEDVISSFNFGIDPKNIKFYTSTKQKLGEGTDNRQDNIYTRWITPLPAEACIRPECTECFLVSTAHSFNKKNRELCNKRCGVKNTAAYHDKKILLGILNKIKASIALTPDERRIKNQIDRYVSKFKSMKKYEGKTLEIDGISIWNDLRTAERCEQHTLNKNVVADTQAYIVESDQAIFILFRGTEYNPADIKLNLMALDQLSFEEKERRGDVHKGFYIAHVALRNFIQETLEESLKKAPHKPIFITGHSLGGAIGHIAMYSLLTSKNVGFKGNLKAIYTFGAPRVGNREFAIHYTQKAKEFGVGVYNLANENDLVPNVPCVDYAHAGAMIYLSGTEAKKSTKATYKYKDLSQASFFPNPGSCGYSTMIKNVFSAKYILHEHKMTTYLEKLIDLKNQLNDYKVSCADDELSLPANHVQLPENIKLNFQSLSADIEEVKY